MPSEGVVGVQLLGRLAVLAGGQRHQLPPAEGRLVAYLAIAGHGVCREAVADCLWRSSDSARSSASLRSALWRLRRSFPGLVEADRRYVALSTGIAVDVVAARATARRVLVDSDFAADMDIATLEADVLPELYDDWALLERERYRQQRLHALEAVARACAERSWFARAVDAAATAVAADPLRESAHRVLVDTHLAEGNVAEARRAYRRCRDVLSDELGVAPSGCYDERLSLSSVSPAEWQTT